ncbi:MAG: beta-ketoacyl-[acyl-carrier-protein] synthase family protein [Chloroflexi bacterium]|nr:beta-ketoacyl-[acyl-carrier-protein] synthase family protein [Chloroflexota bacterium]
MDDQRTIVVTAMGVVSPYGLGVRGMVAGLLAGECCLRPLAGLSLGFDATAAEVGCLPAIEGSQNLYYSRTDQMAMAAARDAVSSAGWGPRALREAAVIIATTVSGLPELDPSLVSDPLAWYQKGGLLRAKSYPFSHAANAVADDIGAGGPRIAANVACASGAIAIAIGANLLLDGVAPLALVGGSDALCPFTLAGFHSLQALDAEPCQPFDENRRGLNLGEGAAVLVLETLARARQRGAPVLAELRGWAMTNDAYHPTAPHEQGRGLAESIGVALEMARARPEDVGYVNAHGTGTPLNDVAEVRAYESAFRSRAVPVPVSSTKSYFGHCLGAAGAIEAAITVSAIREGVRYPTLRLSRPIQSPSVDWLTGPLRRVPLPVAMSVSAGFGGSNAALVFGAYAE